jgi:hypothetical protein
VLHTLLNSAPLHVPLIPTLRQGMLPQTQAGEAIPMVLQGLLRSQQAI